MSDEEKRQFCLNDQQVESLARMAVTIEKHYDRPMDIEWACDGIDNDLYIVQARPETVQSRQTNIIEKYNLKQRSDLVAVLGQDGYACFGTCRVWMPLKKAMCCSPT